MFSIVSKNKQPLYGKCSFRNRVCFWYQEILRICHKQCVKHLLRRWTISKSWTNSLKLDATKRKLGDSIIQC